MPKILHTLIVEDSEDDALLLVRQLRKGGYEPEFAIVSTPQEMEKALGSKRWDMVISDFSMPHFSALGALGLLKQNNLDIPFIIVSGVIGETTAVEAMKAGAHDYLMKDNLARLIPAIERELREAQARSDKRKAQEALGVSEERFHRLVERAADAIFVHDMNGRFTDVNKQACESLGYSQEELLKLSVTDVEIDFTVEQLQSFWDKLITEGPQTINGTHRRKDKTTFPVEVRLGIFEDHEPRLILSLARDITERKKHQEEILQSLREKEVLLREIHHRVKNNLQIIFSLLNLQSGYVKDPRALEMFMECRNRVKSLAIIHEILYQSRDLARVNFAEYIKSLVANLFRSFGVNPAEVQLNINVGDQQLEIDTAIPCGLIINELVSNSLKYAFPEKKYGAISIGLSSYDHSNFVLTVRDDGVGFPENIDFKKTGTLGLQLVNTLTDQIDGNIELNTSNGTEFKITFGGYKHVRSTNTSG